LLTDVEINFHFCSTGVRVKREAVRIQPWPHFTFVMLTFTSSLLVEVVVHPVLRMSIPGNSGSSICHSKKIIELGKAL
jgi:hypothetical protein